jgi:hypothetical protein
MRGAGHADSYPTRSIISDRNLGAVIGFATTAIFDLAALFTQFPERAGASVKRSEAWGRTRR